MPPNNIATNLKKFAFGKGALAAAGGSSPTPIAKTSPAVPSTGKIGVNSSDADKMAQSKLLQEAVKKQGKSK